MSSGAALPFNPSKSSLIQGLTPTICPASFFSSWVKLNSQSPHSVIKEVAVTAEI